MTADQEERMLTFGPVPSRRLGRSLGINNIPPKTCSYACIYCQLGRTSRMSVERAAFFPPEAIARAVRKSVAEADRRGEAIEYITFVPDGEPTLELRLADQIARLRPIGKSIAVITNASLLSRADVREALVVADWVSVKVDAADEETWRRVNRPHGGLELDAIRDGILKFADTFDGSLVTETMLVDGVNDDEGALARIAAFIGRIDPAIAYVSVPIRPPAEPWVAVPSSDALVGAHEIFSERMKRVELLIESEGDTFAALSDAGRSLLEITAVHPMRRSAVEALLARAGEDWDVVDRLLAERHLVELTHRGTAFYVRRLPGR